jgi:biotin carboxyl carrier protein
MELEIKIKDRIAKVKQIGCVDNLIRFSVDDNIYDIDMVKLADGLYSAIYNGKSYNIEMVKGSADKHFIVNTFYSTYNVEIIDAETRYKQNRQKGDLINGENSISTPMPGKIVKIPVKVGDMVEAGQTVVIVSAMKMESEFKTAKAGQIKAIHVKEGDLVDGNKILVVIE